MYRDILLKPNSTKLIRHHLIVQMDNDPKRLVKQVLLKVKKWDIGIYNWDLLGHTLQVFHLMSMPGKASREETFVFWNVGSRLQAVIDWKDFSSKYEVISI